MLGVYHNENDQSYTHNSHKYMEDGALKSKVKSVIGPKFNQGDARLLYNELGYDVVCLTNLGPKKQGKFVALSS